VRSRPDGVGGRELGLALAEGWPIDVAVMRYAAVGGGSCHWAVRDRAGQRRLVTVDDLDDKAWLGDSRPLVISSFAHLLRNEHRRTADTEHAWLALKETAAGVSNC